MDIDVKTNDLKKVVSCTSRVTSNKAIQPILNNILLSCENGSLHISATDLDIAVECKLPADISKPGKITLPAKKLDEIVSKVAGDSIKFSTDKNMLTNIISSNSKFKINGVDSKDYPDITTVEEKEKHISINQKDFLNAVNLVSFSASKFDTTSVLSGINFVISGNKFELGATDGSRLARYIGKLSSGSKGEKNSAVIPGRAMSELERLMSVFKDGNEDISVYLKTGQIIFRNNDFLLSTRLIDSKFPAYDKLIPEEQKSKAIFLRSDLLAALDRVSILANERTSVIKLEFKKGENTIKITADSPDYGNATDEVEVDY
ncbi:MAG: DNA polymerase III subunit beta, partial [Candidatus Melainabacteria bacterium]|nr:DNA polymerase III subunit beta [Candidatus Melainabacteria bacterium]